MPAMKVHQVKARHVNSYVIEDDGGLVVVDVAWRGEKYVLGYIREVLKRDIAEVKLVVCTHGDPDHSGGIMRLARACGAVIGIPHATRSRFLHLANDPTGILFRFATSFAEGLRPRAWRMYLNPGRDERARDLPAYEPPQDATTRDEGLQVDYRLKHGKYLPDFDAWQIIHTPGHSWDSCCYFHEPSRVLISGDTLLGSRLRHKLVKPAIFSNPAHLARSLKRLQALHPIAVYPGHGIVIEAKDCWLIYELKHFFARKLSHIICCGLIILSGIRPRRPD